MARLNRSHGETQAPGILCVVHRSSSVAFLCVFVCIIGSPIHFNCSCSNPNRRHNRRLLSRTTKTRYWIRFQRQQWRKTRQGELTLLESDLGNECRLKMVISCGTPSHRLLRPPPPPLQLRSVHGDARKCRNVRYLSFCCVHIRRAADIMSVPFDAVNSFNFLTDFC